MLAPYTVSSENHAWAIRGNHSEFPIARHLGPWFLNSACLLNTRLSCFIAGQDHCRRFLNILMFSKFKSCLRNSLMGVFAVSLLWLPLAAFAIHTPGDYQTDMSIYSALEKAHTLMEADRYTEARPLMESVTRFDPSTYSGNVHENLAIINRELGNPERGVAQARLAMRYGASPNAFYTMGLCYTDMGKYDEAIKWFRLFMAQNHDAQWQQKTEEIIKNLEDDRSKVSAAPPSKRDYLDELRARDDAKAWLAAKLPFKLYIGSGKGVKGYRAPFKRLILESFDAWCSASGNKLSYKLETDPARADAVVEWVARPMSHVEKNRQRSEAGLTTLNYVGDGKIEHALIQIETYDFDKNREVADSVIKGVCLHELGHAIGMGHSSYVKDIMYFQQTPRQLLSLSPRDRATAARLYNDYPVLKLVTGTTSLPPECFAQPPLPPGANLRYPPIPQSFFAKPPLPPANAGSSDDEDDGLTPESLFAKPPLPTMMKVNVKDKPQPSMPSHFFAQPAPPPAKKKPVSKTSSAPSIPSSIFAKPAPPRGR